MVIIISNEANASIFHADQTEKALYLNLKKLNYEVIKK